MYSKIKTPLKAKPKEFYQFYISVIEIAIVHQYDLLIREVQAL